MKSATKLAALIPFCLLIADCHKGSSDPSRSAVGGHATTVVWIKDGATRADFEAASQRCRQDEGINGKCMSDLGWTRGVSFFCDRGSIARTTCSDPHRTGECQITNCE